MRDHWGTAWKTVQSQQSELTGCIGESGSARHLFFADELRERMQRERQNQSPASEEVNSASAHVSLGSEIWALNGVSLLSFCVLNFSSWLFSLVFKFSNFISEREIFLSCIQDVQLKQCWERNGSHQRGIPSDNLLNLKFLSLCWMWQMGAKYALFWFWNLDLYN